MKFSRRHFIKMGGATGAGILGFGNFAFGREKSFFADKLPAEILAVPLYNANDFRQSLGTNFSLTTQSVVINAVLIAIKSSATSRNKTAQNKKAECFTLTFQLPSDAPQATYTVFHPRFETFDLFLVPGQSGKAESLLHAVINRI